MAEYRPVAWIFWVRIVQLVLAVFTMVCGAYAASQTWIDHGVSFSIWATTWTIVYTCVSIWVLTRLAAHLKPLLTVLICEVASVVFWIITFALLTNYSVSATFVGYKRNVKRAPDHYTELPHCYSNYDQAKCNQEVKAAHSRWKGAQASTKAGTVFAGIEIILFAVTLFMVAMQFRRSKKQPVLQQKA